MRRDASRRHRRRHSRWCGRVRLVAVLARGRPVSAPLFDLDVLAREADTPGCLGSRFLHPEEMVLPRAAVAALLEAVRALIAVEWEDGICPGCGVWEAEAHRDDCYLAAALAPWREEAGTAAEDLAPTKNVGAGGGTP